MRGASPDMDSALSWALISVDQVIAPPPLVPVSGKLERFRLRGAYPSQLTVSRFPMRPSHFILAGFSMLLIAITLTANFGYGRDFLGVLSSVPLGLGDKIGHAVLFGMLALLANLACSGRFSLTASLVVASVACADEASQLFLTNRNFDPVDLIAGLIGITAATLVAAGIARRVSDGNQANRRFQLRQGPRPPLDCPASGAAGDESDLHSTCPPPAGAAPGRPNAVRRRRFRRRQFRKGRRKRGHPG